MSTGNSSRRRKWLRLVAFIAVAIAMILLRQHAAEILPPDFDWVQDTPDPDIDRSWFDRVRHMALRLRVKTQRWLKRK